MSTSTPTQKPLAELQGRFHSHITIPKEYGTVDLGIQGKRTPITLIKNGEEVDTQYMLTHYFVAGDFGKIKGRFSNYAHIRSDLENKVKVLESRGVPVLRLKIEHEIYDDPYTEEDALSSLQGCLYSEIHARFNKTLHRLLDPTWEISFNELDKNGDIFYTKRFFNPIKAKDALSEYEKLKLFSPKELKIETALLDTNPELDKEWLE